jgi:hypothetical protein
MFEPPLASVRSEGTLVMICHNHYGLAAFTSPGESLLRYRQDNRKVSYRQQDVAVITEPTLRPGHVVNLHAMPCRGNSEPNRREHEHKPTLMNALYCP